MPLGEKNVSRIQIGKRTKVSNVNPTLKNVAESFIATLEQIN